MAEKKAGWMALLILLSWSAMIALALSYGSKSLSKEVKPTKATVQTEVKAPVVQAPMTAKNGVLFPAKEQAVAKANAAQAKTINLPDKMTVEAPSGSWKVVSLFYLICVAVFFVIGLLRLPIIDRWMKKYDMKKFKPLLSAIGGATLCFVLAWTESGVWQPSLLFGLLGVPLGLSSVGLHQLLTAGNKKG